MTARGGGEEEGTPLTRVNRMRKEKKNNRREENATQFNYLHSQRSPQHSTAQSADVDAKDESRKRQAPAGSLGLRLGG